MNISSRLPRVIRPMDNFTTSRPSYLTLLSSPKQISARHTLVKHLSQENSLFSHFPPSGLCLTFFPSKKVATVKGKAKSVSLRNITTPLRFPFHVLTLHPLYRFSQYLNYIRLCLTAVFSGLSYLIYNIMQLTAHCSLLIGCFVFHLLLCSLPVYFAFPPGSFLCWFNLFGRRYQLLKLCEFLT